MKLAIMYGSVYTILKVVTIGVGVMALNPILQPGVLIIQII